MAVGRTHRPVWNAGACLPCRVCTRHCPATVFPEIAAEPDSLRGLVARQMAYPRQPEELAAPYEPLVQDAYWSTAAPFHSPQPPRQPAPRSVLPVPPCQAACPLSQDVPAYNSAIFKGDADAALKIIYATNPLPIVCGRVCNRACLRACVRGKLDQPVDIRALKRFAAEHGQFVPPPRLVAGKPRVAVIGAGPAGLAAAHALARRGLPVTIFERQEKPGGLLRYGIGPFDLPPQALDEEIARLAALGVEFRTGIDIGRSCTISRLRESGIEAVLAATGAWRGMADRRWASRPPLGVYDVVPFTFQAALGWLKALDGPAVIVGGGAPAVAAARWAVRLGASSAVLITTRSRDDLPADQDALQRAAAEGIALLTESVVREVLGQDWVTHVRVARVTYEAYDPVGRRRVARMGGETTELPAATVIFAEDREPELDWIAAGETISVRRGPLGNLLARENLGSLCLGPPWLFGAGDLVTGPKTVVEAIAGGLRAAAEIEHYLAAKAPGAELGN